MPKIGEKKIKKIKEEVLALLYDSPMNPLFTSKIADEIIRDEEFTLKILKELYTDGLINEIKTNQTGREFLARRKWTLKPTVYAQYKQLINH
ncbi:hypothetical protein J4438_03265 [Candidatus Woesearchaeota archaeon]|nr:hypothetical protein [Candidatus Woesearchaeota archaeon]